jgi:hypothetical protein
MIAIENKTPRPISGVGFRLGPGISEVDPDAWEKAKKAPVLKALLADGSLVERVSLKQPGSLAELSPAKAIELVKATFDERLLKTWFEAETREKVRSAIKAQAAANEAKLRETAGAASNAEPEDGDAEEAAS